MRLKTAYKKAKNGSIIKSSSVPGSHVVGMPNGGVIPIPLADYDKTMAPKKGNYLLPDINRPSYIDSEGGRRSEYKMGVNINGEEVTIPTVVNGRQLSEDEAIQRYRESGLHMGKYKTPAEADYHARLRTAKYNMLEDPIRFSSPEFKSGGLAKMPGGGVLPNSLDKNLWKEPNYKPIDKNTRTGYDGQGTIYYDPNSNWENINNPEWLEHEKLHHLQWLNGTMHEGSPMSTPPLIASNALQNAYYNRRSNDLNNQVSLMIKENPDLQFIPKEKLISGTTSNADGQKSFLGAEDLMYSNPKTLEGEARTYEDYIARGGKPLFKKGGLQNMPNGGDPPKKKLQWYQQPGTMEEKLRKYGTTGVPLTKSNSEGLSEILSVPQKLVTQAVTGKYETPGEALEKAGVIQNKTDLDVIDFATDPLNYIPLFKAGKLATLSKPQQIFNSTTRLIKNADNLSDVVNSRTLSSPSRTRLVEASKPKMRDGGKYLPTAVSQELARKKEGGKIDHSNDADMVNGVASILRRVKDKKNRLQLANQLSNQFNREKVRYNLSDFLNKSKVKK